MALQARPADTNSQAMLGFSPGQAAQQRALESRFDAAIQRDHLSDWMKRLTARPHHLGSPYDKEMSDFLTDLFRTWGYETEVERFDVLFPTPKTRLLEMTSPERFTATLAEPPLSEDSTSARTAGALPTYNAYSIDGDVSAQLVYVNYGIHKDYDLLAEHGVDVRGKIVIARYGNGLMRGIRPKVAAEHGAIGCLIYSDPRDDGYFQGDPYPKGAWRSEAGAQRGSVTDLPLYPGDPLTPGVGATPEAKRLTLKEAPVLTKIPVLPISAADALPLLRALSGPVAPPEFRGALPITYHLGPGPATVHLKLEFNWDTVPAYDIIAKLPGAERPDEWIIRGNHYDAWVFGAQDPISGAVAMLAEAEALGALSKQGWKPKRTILFTLWDGEEPGLLGSTEWVEAHAEALKQHAAVYVNTDGNHRGFLEAGGSHTLEKFFNEIARELMDPESKVTVSDRLKARELVNAKIDERAALRARPDLPLEALGSGSDYTAFLDHVGIACLNLGYGQEDSGGSYHSIYDSFDHYARFDDPGFDYGVLLARTAGRTVLRLADADVLPFEFSALAGTVENYIKEVIKLADELREETRANNQLIRDQMFQAAADPKQAYVQPEAKPEVPFLNFAPLQNALVKLQESARKFKLAQARTKGRAPGPAEALAALDAALMKMEQAWIRSEGLPRRPWYQHMLYAPGVYAGYRAKTLPGVREAIEQRNWPEAAQQIGVAAETLERYAAAIDRAGQLLKAAAP
jgi:N-acetylated-alpha-linked acidic dipeptidase